MEAKKLTTEKIANNTHWAERYAANMQNRLNQYQADDRKASRIRDRLCRTCYYLRGGLAGQAFTSYTCQECGKEQSHPNTAVPKYCAACSDKYGACQDCGADMEIDRLTGEERQKKFHQSIQETLVKDIKQKKQLIITKEDAPEWKKKKARYGFQCKQCQGSKSMVEKDERRSDGTLVIHVASKESLTYYQRGTGKKICPACYEAAVREGEKV